MIVFFLFECIPYIHHLMHFIKNQAKVQVLFNFGSKINIITLVYILKLSFKIFLINVEIQKLMILILKYLK